MRTIRMPNIKFKCPKCKGSKFKFTYAREHSHHMHGAVCPACDIPVTPENCIPGMPKRSRWGKPNK